MPRSLCQFVFSAVDGMITCFRVVCLLTLTEKQYNRLFPDDTFFDELFPDWNQY
jgi:hypothetical protein